MWDQAEINRLLASIAHTIPPMTEEGFEKVEEWYNRARSSDNETMDGKTVV